MAGSRRNKRTNTKRNTNTRGSNTSLSTAFNQAAKAARSATTKSSGTTGRGTAATQNRQTYTNKTKTNRNKPQRQTQSFDQRMNRYNGTTGNPRRQISAEVKDRQKQSIDTFTDITKGNVKQIAGSHKTTFHSIRNPNEEAHIKAEELKKSRGDQKNTSQFSEGQYGQLVNRTRYGNKDQREKDLKDAAELIDSGAEDIERGKEKLGKAGKFAADVYGAGIGLASDALAGSAAPLSMFSRSFGGSYKSAKDEGASDSKAALYGASIGGLETATEKMFAVATPLRKLYGKGAGDEIFDDLLKRIVNKTTSQTGKDLAYHGGKTLMSAISEGLEEMVAEGLEPAIANQIYAEALGKPHETSAKDIAYAGLVGGAMGGILGGGGQVVEYAQGKQVQDIFGETGIKDLAKKAIETDEDSGGNLAAAAMNEMINEGQGIAAGQANELYRTVYQQEIRDLERERIARKSAEGIMQREGLESPTVMDPQTGEEVLNVNTAQVFGEKRAEAAELMAAMQLPEMQTVQIADAVARIETGVAGIDDVNLFTTGNQTAREVYTSVTGKTLPETNRETREVLYERIAINRVNSARAETEDHADRIRGTIEQNMTQNYESAGQEVFAQIFKDVDVRNMPEVEDAAIAFDDFYSGGRNGIAYADVVSAANPAYENVFPGMKKAAWEAGRQDAFIASDTAKGRQMKIGQTIREKSSQDELRASRGKVISHLSREGKALFKSSDQSLYRMLARIFNINIHIVEDKGFNGFYKDGEMFLSVNADRALSYVFSHEITHHMELYAPEEYHALKELIRTRWAAEGGMDVAVDEKISRYAENNVNLTREEALDEIIADSTYEMIQDESFVEELCRSNRSIAQSVLDAIKAVLKKLRAVLAEGDGFAPKQNAELLSNLDILKEAEKLWADGLMRAAENRNAVGISGMESDEMYSIGYTKDNRAVAIIENDILADVPESQWIGVVKREIKGFRPGVPVSGRLIGVTRKTADHFTNSDATDELRNKQQNVYRDKMNVAQSLDDVIYASTDYINEALKHPRWDDITQFARGSVLIRIGGNDYEAKVIVAYRDSGEMLLYDIQEFRATTLSIKNKRYSLHGAEESVSRRATTSLNNSISETTEKSNIKFSLPDTDDINDYINTHPTEFAEVPPVRDYEKDAARVRTQSIGELQEQVKKLQNDKLFTRGRVLDKSSVEEEMNSLVRTLMSHSSGTANKTDHKLVKMLVENAATIYTAMKDGDVPGAANTAWYAAQELVENLHLIDDSAFHEYKELRDTLRTTAVTISEIDKSSIPDFKDFRSHNMGRLRIVNDGGIPVDTLYAELCEVYPMLFDESITHPADQLMEMAKVREQLEPYDIMLSAEETEQLVKEAAQDILDVAARGKPWKSWADKKKEYYDEKTRTMKARQVEALRDVKIRERMRAEREINKEKLKHKEYKEKQKSKNEHIKRFGSIEKNYKWLADRLVKPTDDKHIPEGFRTSLANLLQAFDLQTDRSKKLEAKYGRPAQKTIRMWELKSQLEKIAKEDGSGVFEYDGYIFELMDALAQKLDGKTIDQATNEELASIDTLLKAIVNNVRSYNSAFSDSIKETMSELAGKAIDAANERISRRGKHNDRSGAIGWADSFLNESMVTPRDFFEQIGGGMQDVFLAMRQGMNKHVDNLTKTRDFFDEIFTPYRNKTAIRKRAKPGSEIEKWRDGSRMQEIELESGKSIRLNPAQMMAFYCSMKREQARGHILGSGIVASRVDNASKLKKALGAKIETEGSAVMISPADAEEIIKKLSPEQIEMADRLQDYLNNECAEWGNEVSLRLYGYRKFTEKDYFPIKSADQYLDSNFEGRQAVERIKNFGFTKGTVVNANNPIMIDDIFTVVADHINKMSLYNAFAAPISDFTRVYNFKARDEGGIITGSVKSSLEDAYGRKTIDYINNFMADVNNTTQTRTEGLGRFVNRSLANYKKATIGGNMRVALQQPTAVMRAFMLISPRHFVNGKINVVKNMRDMKEHCQIARWKAWGHNQVDMARDIDDIMMNNEWTRIDAVTMELYGALDNATWSTIWAAVRSETKAKHPDVKVDSDEFYDICNERASEIFDKTQVVDSVFHRSQVMRNTDTMSKMLTSFMAEPTRTFNMMRSEFVKARDMWKGGEKGKAIRAANKATSIFVMNAALCAAAAAIADALRGKDADDDGEEDGWFENFLANFWSGINPINMLPVAKDIWGFADGWGSQNMALEGYEALVQSVMGLWDAEDKGEAIRKFAESLGLVLGIPIKNVLREIETIFGAFGIDVFAGEVGSAENEVKETIADKWEAFLSGFGIKASKKQDDKGHDRSDPEYYGIYADDGPGLWDKLTDKSYAERKVEDRQKRIADIEKEVKGLFGEERDEAIWKAVTENYTRYIKDGELDVLEEMRRTLEALDGDVEIFDERVLSKVKSAYKNNIGGDLDKLVTYDEYLFEQGYTAEKISQEIIAKSDTATEFQKQMCLRDYDAAVDALANLISAGITEADIYALYYNRHKAIDASDFSTGGLIAPTNGTITSGFGYRNAPTAGASSYHQAIDIGAPEGSDVVAADGGKVTRADWGGGYGWTVEILHGNGRYTKYSHLQGYTVQKGDVVSQGQLIGYVGSTGTSTGPHLDFKVKENGQWVDPMNYFR